ncbi:TetR/AcrR family transcriptional regulator [Hyunsoonleella ulvae]|uniref:TetR/AcrR family transcriptional regulator n=1 Tax=Hyunsoonleella ulvae TaxID=2799948 RepID=UPI001939B8B4|nr:TetR/AcrR family transcriptional regulator [Hyunsoonleella ulvae]
MKNTKDIILQTALKLFNTEGLAKVTLRTIANEMHISQGNLNYHYKKREHIIEALYFKMVEDINQSIVKNMNLKDLLQAQVYLLKAILNTFYNYRFFFLDFVLIIRENPKIKAHYTQLMKQRETEFLSSIHILIENKIIRPSAIPNEYSNLFKRFQILSDFWMSSVVIEKNRVTKTSINQYVEVLMQSLFPYLTHKGQNMYKSLSLT